MGKKPSLDSGFSESARQIRLQSSHLVYLNRAARFLPFEEAIDRGGRPSRILEAENFLLEAVSLRMVESFSLAIGAYKDALKQAGKA